MSRNLQRLIDRIAVIDEPRDKPDRPHLAYQRGAEADRERCLVKAFDDRAVIDHPDTTESRALRPGQQAILHVSQNLELLAQLLAEALLDRGRRPFEDIDVPSRAVVESKRRDPAKDVVRPEPIGDGGVETLALWVRAVQSAVFRNEDALDRAGEAVVAAGREVTEERSEGCALDRGDGGIARVHREIPDRSAKAEAIDELQGNRPSNGVDGNDLIVHLGVVDVPTLPGPK